MHVKINSQVIHIFNLKEEPLFNSSHAIYFRESANNKDWQFPIREQK